MKTSRSLAAVCLFFSATAFAAPNSELLKSTLESQTTCDNFVRFDESYLLTGANQFAVRMTSLDENKTERTFSAGNRAIDAVRINNTLWILTTESLEEWNFATGEKIATHATFKAERKMGTWEHPTGMAVTGTKIVMSHGTWGLSIFDTETKSLVASANLNAHQVPMVSMATGVAIAGSRAYFSMDDVTMVQPGEKNAFRGIVVFNLETNQIEANLDNMDPGSDALATDGQKLIVSFMGMPVWKYSLGALTGTSAATPQQRVWMFGREGHPTGRASVDGKYYYTCFQERSSDGKYRNIPLALDRAAIKLD